MMISLSVYFFYKNKPTSYENKLARWTNENIKIWEQLKNIKNKKNNKNRLIIFLELRCWFSMLNVNFGNVNLFQIKYVSCYVDSPQTICICVGEEIYIYVRIKIMTTFLCVYLKTENMPTEQNKQNKWRIWGLTPPTK